MKPYPENHNFALRDARYVSGGDIIVQSIFDQLARSDSAESFSLGKANYFGVADGARHNIPPQLDLDVFSGCLPEVLESVWDTDPALKLGVVALLAHEIEVGT